MCLAIPGQIKKIEGHKATVKYPGEERFALVGDEKLKKGDPLIYEPDLKELLEKNLSAKRIQFSLEYKNAVAESDIVFITVGTPTKENGEADLKNVYEVSKMIAKNLKKPFTVICCKSTVPVGTNKKITEIIKNNKSENVDFAVASCPEFLREGTAIFDSFNPDRIVIGSDSKKAKNYLTELHKPIKGKRILTNLASAELIKYASNLMLATKISFANFISFLAEKSGADAEIILDSVGLDKRIGKSFLNPGIGYGGSCLPKDVNALIDITKKLKLDTGFLKSISAINIQARDMFAEKILSKIKPNQTIAIWGLSFKPNTDDIRESPALYIISKLLKNNITIKVYDPAAMNKVKSVFKNKIIYSNDKYKILKGSYALCIFTEWGEFKKADLNKIKTFLKKPIIFDGRNIYSLDKIDKYGFEYYGVGRNIL